MITLMTGAPGTGKTAKIVFEASKVKNRPIFVMGIPDLKIPHETVPPIAEWTRLVPTPEDPKLLVPEFTFPPNAIIIIDEAQHVYRPRASASKVPDHVAAFETHRHLGIDFWLLTQHPSLLDSNIRRLIKRHWHIHDTPLGRKLLEWSQCRDPDSKAERADAVTVDYKPPKEVFDLYKSAEVHTKVRRRLPAALFVVVVAVLLLVALAVFLGYRIKSKIAPSVPVENSEVKAPAAGVSSVPTSIPATDPAEYMTSFYPRHPDYPESAPAYDGLRQVKSVPVIAGCIKTAAYCRCYSQQATLLDVLPDRCAAIVANKVFDPYREDRKPEPLTGHPVVVADAKLSPVAPSPVVQSDTPNDRIPVSR